jgi:NAD(P)H-nitrite reductase large subunit
MVCPCSDVSVADLNFAWEQGFQEMELLKRATLAGTGTCQGSVCLPYLRSFLAQRGGQLQPAFTARPVTRQLTMGEMAAGGHHHPMARTALAGEHRRLGAQMERSGGWRR